MKPFNCELINDFRLIQKLCYQQTITLYIIYIWYIYEQTGVSIK